MPGVERTLRGSDPATSVSSRPSASNSCAASIPCSSVEPDPMGTAGYPTHRLRRRATNHLHRGGYGRARIRAGAPMGHGRDPNRDRLSRRRAGRGGRQPRSRGSARGHVHGFAERRGGVETEIVDPERAVPQPVRDADEPQGRAPPGPARSSMPRSRSPPRSAARRPGRSASGRARRPSRRRRWFRRESRVVSAFHTVSAALLTDLDHDLDEDVLDLR